MDAILWDMDGSLINSEPLWEIATYDLSERIGRRLTPELRARCVGNTLRNTVSICAQYAGVQFTEELFDDGSHFLEHRFTSLVRENGVTWRPGVQRILAEAQSDGLPVVLVTNTRRDTATPCIEAMGLEHFTATVCGDDVPNGKPEPDPYLRGAELAGVSPSQCLALEDSTVGVRSALSAGCEVLWTPMLEAPAPAADIKQFAPPARHHIGDLGEWTLDKLRAAFATDAATWNNSPSEEL